VEQPNQSSDGQTDPRVYTAPDVPSDIPAEFTPEPGSRAADWLAEGKTSIDLHALYRQRHQDGWDHAVSEYESTKTFTMNSLEDAAAWQADLEAGTRGFWDGYCAARAALSDE
jgi:hypothetical protein